MHTVPSSVFTSTRMYKIRQLEVPSAFLALYSKNGRIFATREFIETRFEACEDLAHGVSTFCTTLAFRGSLSEEAVLQRCHAGLLQTPETVSAQEAAWVTCRTAELLEWGQPTLAPATSSGASVLPARS